MEKMENQDIICIAGVDFEPLWARTQQLVWRFPASNRIVYIETPLSIMSPIKDPTLWYKWRLWRQGIRKCKDNLYLFSPPLLLPFANRFRWINRINQRIMAGVLRRVAAQLGFRDPLLLTYLPNTVDMLDYLPTKLVVYDCVDEHSAFQGFNPAVVSQMEQELLQRSDLVLATAQPLYEDKAPYAKNIHLVRNAADVEHFNQARQEALPLPGDVRGIKGTVLGFIGRIKEWIDLELIREVAMARPDWNIVMVGPVELDADISLLREMRNVWFIGQRSKEELPGYLKKFDVCLNPFRAGALSRAVNPLKLYEYLASGKPVVSTPMPEMDLLAGMVEIGDGKEGFVAAIERALNDNEDKRRSRLEFAREQSWENRVDQMGDLISQALKGKGTN